jgi:apolipoprotein N-acyltransferase
VVILRVGVRIVGTWWRVAAAGAAGGLLSLCFPGFNVSVLVWLWMIPLLVALWTLKPGKRVGWRGFGLGWIAGAVFFGISCRWLLAVSGLGAVVVSGFLALYFAAWAGFAATWGNPWRRERMGATAATEGMYSLGIAFANAALWVGLEWLRGWLFSGFSWNGLGVAFHTLPVLAQGADLLGVAGLSFLPVFVSTVWVQAGRRMARQAREGRLRSNVDFMVAAVMLILAFVYGVWRIHSVAQMPTVPVNVLLVQRNIPQSIKWQAQSADEIYAGYAEATRAALEALESENMADLKQAVGGAAAGQVVLRRPDLVIWPETALPERLWFVPGEPLPGSQWNAGYISEAVLKLGDFTFITGANEFEAQRVDSERLDARAGGDAFNSMAFFRGDFSSGRTYRKIHRVPFGEYIPFRKQLPLLVSLFEYSAGVESGGDFAAGNRFEPVAIEASGHEVGIIPAICFEDTVNRLIRRFVRRGPQMIVNVTNDGWFLQTVAAEQHAANASFRCIETRRPMVRAANTGVTCIIDTTGSMLDRKAADGRTRSIRDSATGSPFVEGTLYGQVDVPEQGITTLYNQVGDVPVILLGLIGLASGWIQSRRR